MATLGIVSIENMSAYLQWYVMISIVVEIIGFIEIIRIEKEIRNGKY